MHPSPDQRSPSNRSRFRSRPAISALRTPPSRSLRRQRLHHRKLLLVSSPTASQLPYYSIQQSSSQPIPLAVRRNFTGGPIQTVAGNRPLLGPRIRTPSDATPSIAISFSSAVGKWMRVTSTSSSPPAPLFEELTSSRATLADPFSRDGKSFFSEYSNEEEEEASEQDVAAETIQLQSKHLTVPTMEMLSPPVMFQAKLDDQCRFLALTVA